MGPWAGKSEGLLDEANCELRHADRRVGTIHPMAWREQHALSNPRKEKSPPNTGVLSQTRSWKTADLHPGDLPPPPLRAGAAQSAHCLGPPEGVALGSLVTQACGRLPNPAGEASQIKSKTFLKVFR